MNSKKKSSLIFIIHTLVLIGTAPTLMGAPAAAATIGIFEDHGDVGTLLHPGSAEYDPATASYTISGGGANMLIGGGFTAEPATRPRKPTGGIDPC